MPVPTEPGAFWWRNVEGHWRGLRRAVNVDWGSAPLEGWDAAELASYEATGDIDAFDHELWWPRALTVCLGEEEYPVNDEHAGRPFAHPLGGEWEERIPDSDTLKAMREVCAADPMVDDSHGGTYCWHCEAVPRLVSQVPRADGRGSTCTYDVKHPPGCPWLRSQEKADDAT